MTDTNMNRHCEPNGAEAVQDERLTRLAVAACFFLIAGFSVNQIATMHIATLDLLGWARLISTVALVSFFLMIAWLTLVRPRAVAQAPGPGPRIAAVLGTWLFLFGAPFLTRRTDLGAPALLLSASLILLGDVLAVLILQWLGRSFSIMAEARKLVTTGPYAIVRHPLYAAELVAVLGLVIQFGTIEAVVLAAAQFGFQVIRMRNEEAVLRRTFPEYAAYMARTARLIPALW